MKKFTKISLVAFAICFGLTFVSCSSSNSNKESSSEVSEVYACPMHPEVTGKKGDKCTKCSMDLELVKK
jgi:hypothetical protein